MRTSFRCVLLILLAALVFAQDEQSDPATDGHFVVDSQSFRDFPFSVGEGVKQVRLSGSFKAAGGTANYVFVLVMTDDQYTRWQKPHSVSATPENGGSLYNSGRTDHAKIDLPLPDKPTNYHLVFNNRFPYAKTIDTDLTWRWQSSQ